MKTYSVFILFLIITFSACTKHEKSTITVRAKNAPGNEMAYLHELRVTGEYIIDSMRVRNSGKFRFNVPQEVPGFYQVVFSSGPSLSLILSPGEKLNITADMDNFYESKKLEGSPNSIRLNLLHDSLRNAIGKLNAIVAEYTLDGPDKPKTAADSGLLEQKYLSVRAGHHRFSSGFILEDLRSLANIGALYQEYGPGDYVFGSARDLQFFMLVTDTLSKYYPDLRHVKNLR
jgi:hypothetical protein